tara:strand:+ start:1040 stop:2623 length:1584 start_codon:yes stop_codon:yes gene_type:complete
MLKYKNVIILFALLFYGIVGSYFSISNGISHDQLHEQHNWRINFDAIKGLIYNNGDYAILIDYLDKYHGIAFHYFSQPIQLLTHGFIGELNQVSNESAYYISRHLAVFIIFSISGIFFYLLSYKVANNKNFSIIATSIYLLYPYFFGHAQINAKDIPFLSFWVICNYYLFIIVENFYFNKKNSLKIIFLLSFLTAFLIGIRITGILILLEYLIALTIFINVKNISLISFLNDHKKFFIFFSILLCLFVYILSPVFWLNPLEFFKSIEWMGKYYHDICTLTFGKCVRALNLPSSYIFIWLFFKLPILILFGILIYPFVEKTIMNNGIKTIHYLTLLFTFLIILFIFIFKKVALYDEIRHIMFLIPSLFLLALYNVYIFNKKIYYLLSMFVIIFFIFENVSLKKYQYTWLNSFAKFTHIEKNFEIDYLGISNKNIQLEIIDYVEKNDINKDICIYGGPYTEVFLERRGFTCFNDYSVLDSIKFRPFFAYQNVRNVKRSKPKDCDLIHQEKYNYLLYEDDIVTGKLWFCQ